MRLLVLIALLTPFAVPDRSRPVDAAKDEVAKLDGTWAVVAYEFDGGRFSEAEIAAYPRLIMKGGAYRWSNAETGGAMTIDPATTPRAVDYRQADGPGPEKGALYLGIYDLQGDTFRDCIAPPGKDRPRAFSAPPGSGHTLFVYRRVKT